MSISGQDANFHRLMASVNCHQPSSSKKSDIDVVADVVCGSGNQRSNSHDHGNHHPSMDSAKSEDISGIITSKQRHSPKKSESEHQQPTTSTMSFASTIFPGPPPPQSNMLFLYDKSNFNHFQSSSSSSSSSDDGGAGGEVSRSDEINDTNKEQCQSEMSVENNTENMQTIAETPSVNYGKASLLNSSKKSSSSSLSSAMSATSSSSSAVIDASYNPNSMDENENCLAVPQLALPEDSSSEDDKLLNRRQWYHLWLPSYKSRLNQFQRQFIDKISPREKLIDDFVCAIQRELLLQGRMYVSLNYISFYSNIFGYETIINISYHDISSISKASTVRLFPNAIQIITNSGLKYFFTSFVSRERAFRLITRLWRLARQAQPMPWPEIRKLIRESYTTSGLGIDLSDIDDADVEIDLSKATKKKKSKRKINSNRSSQLNAELIEDGDESILSSNRTDILTDLDSPTLDSHQPRRHRRLLHNADVQTDSQCFDDPSHHHQCSLIEVCKQRLSMIRGKISQTVTIIPSSQSHIIRFLFFIALVLSIIQLNIYFSFTNLNQRLRQTEQLLIEALQKRNIVNSTSCSESAGLTGVHSYLTSDSC